MPNGGGCQARLAALRSSTPRGHHRRHVFFSLKEEHIALADCERRSWSDFGGGPVSEGHSVMTVSVVMASLVPIMWSHGVGSDLMKPIAAPIVGGMITSTVHVLIVTPVIFYIMKMRALQKGRPQRIGDASVMSRRRDGREQDG
jgi:hypothetical protein